MRTGKSLLGLSIVGQQDGKNLGTVKDLFFDHESDQLMAFVLFEKDLFGLIDAIIVPWREVTNIAGDVVMVTNENSRIKLKDDPLVREMANRETVLSGTKVLSQDGKQLGTLADMFIDETNGRVVGYEVSVAFSPTLCAARSSCRRRLVFPSGKMPPLPHRRPKRKSNKNYNSISRLGFAIPCLRNRLPKYFGSRFCV